jgi:hypothetical protein
LNAGSAVLAAARVSCRYDELASGAYQDTEFDAFRTTKLQDHGHCL